jgi:hypothetical protein
MPDDVFEEYIGGSAKKVPWTFDSISDSVVGTEWDYKFMHQSIELIANLRWRISELPFDLAMFHERSLDTLECLAGIKTPSRPLPADSRSKIAFHIDHLCRHGKLIKPLILQRDTDGYRILDGHHRVSALNRWAKDDFVFDCWIGERPHI